MLCLGTSIALIVTGRVLQGLAAAIVWCVGLALLVDTVGHEEIGKIMGYVTLSMSLAIILAPLLGGIVYARAGYYAVFYMAFGLIATDIIMRIALIEKKMAKKWGLAVKELDPEAIHSSPTPPVSSFEVVTASSPTSKSPVPALETAIAFTPDLPFFKTSSLPPVLTLLSSYRLLTALWGVLVEAALLTAFDSVIPLRVRHLFSWNSTGAGLIFLALILPTFISPIIGALSDKYGPRWFTFAGFLASAPCLILLRFVDHSGVKQIVLLCALLALLGLALTMLVTPLLAEITYVVAAREKMQPGVFGAKGAYAQAFGLFNSAFAAGTLVGPIWAGFVSEKAGWVTMGWSLGLLSAVSAVPVVSLGLSSSSPEMCWFSLTLIYVLSLLAALLHGRAPHHQKPAPDARPTTLILQRSYKQRYQRLLLIGSLNIQPHSTYRIYQSPLRAIHR